LEGLSARVVGFKVKAGLVAGMSSTSETNKCGPVCGRQQAAFSHLRKRKRGAKQVGWASKRMVLCQSMGANIDNDDGDMNESGLLFVENTKRRDEDWTKRQEPQH
jgi:hypothetical protein